MAAKKAGRKGTEHLSKRHPVSCTPLIPSSLPPDGRNNTGEEGFSEEGGGGKGRRDGGGEAGSNGERRGGGGEEQGLRDSSGETGKM